MGPDALQSLSCYCIFIGVLRIFYTPIRDFLYYTSCFNRFDTSAAIKLDGNIFILNYFIYYSAGCETSLIFWYLEILLIVN